MQTKQQIERLLASAGLSPNKRLGQHFLIDLNLMRLLLDTARIHHNDIILEIGCGTGSFTEGLAEAAGAVIGVEYDDNLARIAAGAVKKAANVKIINADVLESKNRLCPAVSEAIDEARGEFNGRMLLVANLPYNVAASVMMNLIIGPEVVDGMHVTVQKEVAQRMTATAGEKNYGILSILMAAAGQVKLIRNLRPSVFWPRPEVESSMVSFVRQRKNVQRIHDIELFREVVGLFMGHRRKMLKACVKFSEGRLEKVHKWGDVFAQAFVEPHHRPEELSADDYISIANLCSEQIL